MPVIGIGMNLRLGIGIWYQYQYDFWVSVSGIPWIVEIYLVNTRDIPKM